MLDSGEHHVGTCDHAGGAGRPCSEILQQVFSHLYSRRSQLCKGPLTSLQLELETEEHASK